MRPFKTLVRRCVLGVVLGVTVACSPGSHQESSVRAAENNLVFLTRQGCVNTVTMRERFDEALKALGLPHDYQFIDADTLAASDPRGGYGTPTILHEGRDVFGMPEPTIPPAPPT